MKKSLILLPLAALLASPAVAQGPRPGPDADGDGIVTRAEESAEADRRFARMDANRDGTVTPEERRAERERMRAERRDRVVTEDQFKERAEKRFERLDANDDGRLTGDERRMGRRGPKGAPSMRGRGGPRPEPKAETLAEHRARALERFDRIDTDRDGRLTEAERAADRARRGPPPPPPGGPVPPPAR